MTIFNSIPRLLANLRDMTCDTLWRKKKRDRPIPETIPIPETMQADTMQPHQPSRLSTSESFRYRYVLVCIVWTNVIYYDTFPVAVVQTWRLGTGKEVRGVDSETQ